MQNRLKIAMYLRLSKEDDRNTQESNSISCQRLLLKEYIEQNFRGEILSDEVCPPKTCITGCPDGYTLSDEVCPPKACITGCPYGCEIFEFVDDGYGGTSMDRPAMQELLRCIRQKKVDCVIVKDFSRFSRDYVEMGFYVEQLFPFLGIRFISVNDHYDSRVVQNQMMGMDLAFKALVNDLYSKDLSGKVISSLHSKKERGIYCSANCPFGYRKKADDKNQVEIVPEEAKVIREIFRLTLEGYSSVDIAKKFHKEKIKTPVEYLAARGVTHRNPLGKEFSWHHTTICKILRNDFYAGDVVYGKYEKDAVGGKNHLKPKSEWKITYHHHEPIIEREIFEEVQRTRGISKPYQPRKAHMLTGKVLCGECGRALCYRNAKHPYFYCKDRYATGNENCLKKVNIFLLEQMLVSVLQKEICRQIELKEVWKLYQEVQKRQYDAKMAKLRKARKNLEITGKEQIILYERYKKKEILKEEYLACKEKVQKKEDAIKSEIQRQKMLLVEMEAEKHTGLPDADKIWKACKVYELNQETVDSFIRKVKVWDERHVEIIWNFSDGKAT